MELYFVYGYLGSGKTTFVKNFLAAAKNKRVAVVVNDFGENDVDGVTLMRYAATLSPISGGSIFCSCKSDRFVEVILNLCKGDFDCVLIETSGLANPFTLSNLLPLIAEKSEKEITLGLSYCLVDLMTAEKLLPTISMMKMQIAAADVVLLNKTDLVGKTDTERMRGIVRDINQNCAIESTIFSFCKKGLFSFEKTEKNLPSFITDLNTQKITIKVSETSLVRLNEFCGELALFCHRIKGVIKLNGEKLVYQYMYGKTSTEKAKDGESGFLVALSCSKIPLKKEALKLQPRFDFIVEIV